MKSIRDYKEIKELGAGAFGIVTLVKNLNRDQERGKEELYALKKVSKKFLCDIF